MRVNCLKVCNQNHKFVLFPLTEGVCWYSTGIIVIRVLPFVDFASGTKAGKQCVICGTTGDVSIFTHDCVEVSYLSWCL